MADHNNKRDPIDLEHSASAGHQPGAAPQGVLCLQRSLVLFS